MEGKPSFKPSEKVSINHEYQHLDYILRLLYARPMNEVEVIVSNIREQLKELEDADKSSNGDSKG